jgi:regulator of protease activity HflC (stomatin/prohibitin superfamily)
MQNIKPEMLAKLAGGLAAPVLLGLLGINQALYKVNTGEQAIKFNYFTGLGSRTYIEGYHFKIPFIESAIKFQTRARVFECEANTPNKDS